MVVHSVMKSMEPPVSAEMSQIAKNLAKIDKENINNIAEYLFTKSQYGTQLSKMVHKPFLHPYLNVISIVITIIIKFTNFIFKVKILNSQSKPTINI